MRRERDERKMTVLNGTGEMIEYHDIVHAPVSFKEVCIVRFDMHDWIQGLLGMIQRVLSSGWHESLSFCIISVHSFIPRSSLTVHTIPPF